jgi:hypothetical protein
MPKVLSMSSTSRASRKWRELKPDDYKRTLQKHRATHDMLEVQKRYDIKRAEYKKQVRALLRMLNNLYIPI